MQIPNESDLILRAQAGDQESFETLLLDALEKSKPLLSKYYQGIREDCEEAIQSSSLRAWSRIASFKGHCSFFTWFCSILRHELVTLSNAKRKLKNREFSMEEITDCEGNAINIDKIKGFQGNENPQFNLLKKEESVAYRELLNKVLAKLAPSHAEVLKIILEQEKSYKEASELLNLSIGTVMSRMFYAKKHAQKLILELSAKEELDLPLAKFHV